MGRVLVVDDEQSLRDVMEVLVSSNGHAPTVVASVPAAKEALKQQDFDVVITDLRLEPDGDGMDVVRAAAAQGEPPEVIVMTAYGTRENAQTAIAEGASFYLEKGPHLAADVQVLMRQAIRKRKLLSELLELRKIVAGKQPGGIVGKSEAMQEIFDLLGRVSPLKATVLITGENGTGKERIARAVHDGSPMAEGPFLAVNCGAIPEALIESELFGVVKGAFTGADRDRTGLFEAASGGTIFLDEIGELPVALQPKLLRVLQEHKVKRVGAVEEQDVDVRVVAATNRDLEGEVRAGRFREDLYFRLNVLPIELPPLRERREDIPLLARTFLTKFAELHDRPVTQIDPDAMACLLDYHYPGNVRELENMIERGVALARDSRITRAQLPKEVQEPPQRFVNPRGEPVGRFPEGGVDLEALVETYEYGLMRQALSQAGGVKTKAAELLGLSFRQFRYKLSKYERRKEK